MDANGSFGFGIQTRFAGKNWLFQWVCRDKAKARILHKERTSIRMDDLCRDIADNFKIPRRLYADRLLLHPLEIRIRQRHLLPILILDFLNEGKESGTRRRPLRAPGAYDSPTMAAQQCSGSDALCS